MVASTSDSKTLTKFKRGRKRPSVSEKTRSRRSRRRKKRKKKRRKRRMTPSRRNTHINTNKFIWCTLLCIITLLLPVVVCVGDPHGFVELARPIKLLQR